MQNTTIEGIVINGQIVLSQNVNLPEMTKVNILITPIETKRIPRIMSPHLVDKSKLADFEREIIDIEDDEI